MRMQAQTAAIENGFVRFPKEVPWLHIYLDELTASLIQIQGPSGLDIAGIGMVLGQGSRSKYVGVLQRRANETEGLGNGAG